MGVADLPVDLVFEGGGMKGIGLVGALAVLEEAGYVARRRAGSSAGAIAAALHAAGYSAAELRELLLETDFRRFMDRSWEDRIPLAGAPLSVLLDFGVFEGDAFEEWLDGLLSARGVRTFGDLLTGDPGPDPRSRWTLQVVVSDVTAHEMLVLPRDAERKLGVDPDGLEVAAAVRASMSIPVFFEPRRIVDPRDGVEHLLVDGGMLSNFPVWVFDSEEPRWPTFGLLLVEANTRSSIAKGVTEPAEALLRAVPAVRFAVSIVQTMLEAHDRLYVEQADFARTIPIETLGVGTTEFGLARERREALYASGRRAAEKFLPFDFDAYVAAFRTGKRPSRRDGVERVIREQGGAA